jgi:DNA-binding transcriptional regulator YhcF (GntR family)
MRILLSNTDKTPIYEQLEQQLRNAILEGKLEADEPLPSIRKFARDLSISIITVKRAYDDLEREGYIHTIGGKGSFVAGQSLERLREKQVQLVENDLETIIKNVKILDISKKDFNSIIDMLWDEGE